MYRGNKETFEHFIQAVIFFVHTVALISFCEQKCNTMKSEGLHIHHAKSEGRLFVCLEQMDAHMSIHVAFLSMLTIQNPHIICNIKNLFSVSV